MEQDSAGGHQPIGSIAGRTDAVPSAWSKEAYKYTFDKSTPVQAEKKISEAAANYKKIDQDQAEMRVATDKVATREITVEDILNDPNNRFKNMSQDEAEMKLANLRLDGRDRIAIAADKKPTESSYTNNTPAEKNEEKKGFFSRLKDKFNKVEEPDDSKMTPEQELADYKKMQKDSDNYYKQKQQGIQDKPNPVVSAESPKVYGKVDPEVQEMRDMNAQMDQYYQQNIEENKPLQDQADIAEGGTISSSLGTDVPSVSTAPPTEEKPKRVKIPVTLEDEIKEEQKLPESVVDDIKREYISETETDFDVTRAIEGIELKYVDVDKIDENFDLSSINLEDTVNQKKRTLKKLNGKIIYSYFQDSEGDLVFKQDTLPSLDSVKYLVSENNKVAIKQAEELGVNMSKDPNLDTTFVDFRPDAQQSQKAA